MDVKYINCKVLMLGVGLVALSPIALPLPATAQVQSAPLLYRLPVSVRAAAQGVHSTVAREPGDIWWNPALAADVRGIGLSWGNYGVEGNIGSVTGAGDWGDFSVAISVRAASYGLTDPFDTPGPSDAFSGGPFATSEIVGSAAVAREVGFLKLGVTGALIERRVGASVATAGSFGFGVLVDWLGLTWGGSVSNLGPSLNHDSVAIAQPTEFAVGVGLGTRPLGPLDISAFTSVVLLEEGAIVPEGGVEISYWPIQGRTFLLRGGVRPATGGGEPSVLSFGVGFRADNVTFAYSSENHRGVAAAHHFGVWWR